MQTDIVLGAKQWLTGAQPQHIDCPPGPGQIGRMAPYVEIQY